MDQVCDLRPNIVRAMKLICSHPVADAFVLCMKGKLLITVKDCLVNGADGSSDGIAKQSQPIRTKVEESTITRRR